MLGFFISETTRRNFGMYSLQWGHQVAKKASICTFFVYLFKAAIDSALGAYSRIPSRYSGRSATSASISTAPTIGGRSRQRRMRTFLSSAWNCTKGPSTARA